MSELAKWGIKIGGHYVAADFLLLCFLSLNFSHHLVDVLTVTFTSIKEELEVRNSFHLCVLFEVLSKLSSTSLQEDECVVFFSVWNGGKENNCSFQIRRDINSRDGDKRVGIGFMLDEASGAFLDKIADSALAF